MISGTGDWLPVLNHQRAPALVEQNEQGVILYASNRSLPNTRIDGYFIYKQDDRELANGDDADIYTTGGKIAGHVGRSWSYSLEGAYQFGSKNDPMVTQPVAAPGRRRIDAFGATRCSLRKTRPRAHCVRKHSAATGVFAVIFCRPS